MPTSQINKSNFNKACRICLQTEYPNMYFIHESTILEMFQYCCTTLTINTNDGLPNQICQNCFTKLNDSFQFKQLCEKSHRILVEIRDENDTKDSNDLYVKDELVELTDVKPLLLKTDSDRDNDDYATQDIGNDDGEEVEDDSCDDEWLSDRIESNKTKRSQLDSNKCDPQTLTCKTCNKNLSTVGSLLRHLRTHELNEDQTDSSIKRDENKTKYKCDYCDLSYCKISSLGKHVLTKHNPTLLACTMCNKKFAIQLQLDTHMKFIHRQQKDHVCKQCGKIFQKNHQLMRHEKSHATERIYHCMQCDKSFRVEATLRIHYRVCHSADKKREVCTICGKAVYRIKQHLARVHTDEHVTCPECSKEFNNKHYLEEHRKRKHGDPNETNKRPHLCSICGKGSVSTTALKAHYQHMHTVGKRYPCPICNKKFKTDQAVNAHVRYTHNHESRYSCTMCSKTFQISSRLKIHMRVHTGERPCVCKLCNKAFGESSTLKKHMRVHGSFESEKPVKNELNDLIDNVTVNNVLDDQKNHENMQRFLINF